MGGPAPAVPAPDATCTLLPLTSFPKNKIKVLLLENISHTAIELFESECFQIVRISSHLLMSTAFSVYLALANWYLLKLPSRSAMML